jgi:hypothetical protein
MYLVRTLQSLAGPAPQQSKQNDKRAIIRYHISIGGSDYSGEERVFVVLRASNACRDNLSEQKKVVKRSCQNNLEIKKVVKVDNLCYQNVVVIKKITTFLANFLSTYVDRDGCHFNAP